MRAQKLYAAPFLKRSVRLKNYSIQENKTIDRSPMRDEIPRSPLRFNDEIAGRLDPPQPGIVPCAFFLIDYILKSLDFISNALFTLT